jgi:hypothetical protein
MHAHQISKINTSKYSVLVCRAEMWRRKAEPSGEETGSMTGFTERSREATTSSCQELVGSRLCEHPLRRAQDAEAVA